MEWVKEECVEMIVVCLGMTQKRESFIKQEDVETRKRTTTTYRAATSQL